MEPIVDVNVAVYNHAPYLKRTLDGILNQNTNFRFRLIIGDDFSTDGSREILKEYETRFPDEVKVIYQEKNLGFHSSERNGIIMLQQSTAKYIALCDGDDYWTDPDKLQKQVDFLEQNNQYSACCTEAEVVYEKPGIPSHLYANYLMDKDISTEEILVNSKVPSCTILFKNIILPLPNWFIKSLAGDTLIMYFLSRKGKIRFLNAVTSCYRKQSAGIYTGVDPKVHLVRNIEMFKLILENDNLPAAKLLRKLVDRQNLNIAYLYSFERNMPEAWTFFRRVSRYAIYDSPKMWFKTLTSMLFRPFLETTGFIKVSRP